MNEKIAAIIISGNESFKKKNGETDVLLFDESNKNINIKTDDDIFSLKENIDKLDVEQNDEKYHINLIKNYLKSNFCKEFTGLNLDRFTPSNCFSLYKIFSSFGNILIINSIYMIPIFCPKIENLTEDQINSLKRLSEIMLDNTNVDIVFISSNLKEIDEFSGNYDEMIKYIEEKRKVKRY